MYIQDVTHLTFQINTFKNEVMALTEHVLAGDPRPGLHQAPDQASVQPRSGRVEQGAALGVGDVDVAGGTAELIMTVIVTVIMMMMSTYQGLNDGGELHP